MSRIAQTTAAVTFAGLLALGSAQAARITFTVTVPGYPSATVKPELAGILGGRVAYLPQYGGWVTDRVARGEWVNVNFTADRAGEYRCNGRVWGLYGSNPFTFSHWLNTSVVSTVTYNTGYGSVTANAQTEAGTFQRSVPIGSRP